MFHPAMKAVVVHHNKNIFSILLLQFIKKSQVKMFEITNSPAQNRPFYYTNTNKIPSELLHKNMISSHMKKTLSSHAKISLLLWLHMKIALFDAFREVI